MTHFKYLNSIKRIVNGTWGNEGSSPEEADKALVSNDEKLTAWCLVKLLKDIEKFKQALLYEETDNQIINLGRQYESSLKDFFDEREEKHGPCPESVKKYIRLKLQQNAGWFLLELNTIPEWVMSGERAIPPKGTELRKEYDRWMWRKPKKSEVSDVRAK